MSAAPARSRSRTWRATAAFPRGIAHFPCAPPRRPAFTLSCSSVNQSPFVGPPHNDLSNVGYYVDDVVIGTDEGGRALPPFVAPGRRKLFVDLFRDYQKLLRERPRCLPPSTPEDVGLTWDDLA